MSESLINQLAPINPETGERDFNHSTVKVRRCGKGSQPYCYASMAPVTQLHQRGVIWTQF